MVLGTAAAEVADTGKFFPTGRRVPQKKKKIHKSFNGANGGCEKLPADSVGEFL